MMLSKLLAMVESPAACYGVEVDSPAYAPPAGLKEIGLLLQVEAGIPNEDFLDVAFSFSIAGVDVIIEVPFGTAVDATYLLTLASNANLSLSVLPPENPSEEEVLRYAQGLVTYAHGYLSKNMKGDVYPVTSYLQFMFAELIGDVSAFKPNDGYIVDSFHSKLTIEQQDAIKAVLKAGIYDAFSGKDEFETFALSLMGGIYKQAKETSADYSRMMEEEAEATGAA